MLKDLIAHLAILLWFTPALTRTSAAELPAPACKTIPDDPDWPSPATLEAFNATISGRLILTVPPAIVCYPSEPEHYDLSACRRVLDQWHNSTFHGSDPASVDYPFWAGNSCPPIYPNGTSVNGDTRAGDKGCTLGGYPAYVVNATEAAHVQEAIRFAARWNLRLIVKNTGHNFAGRSTAFGSLSIWTHNLRGIEFHEDFQPENCALGKKQMAATIAAGETVVNVYREADKHGAVVVAGSGVTVGVAGWFSGGGHGPLSSDYGMGADNVLQVKMVTPQGNVITANSCQNPDLFWAIRGGGGTFGVALEVVMKAYPTPQSALLTFSAEFDPDMTNASTFWDMMAEVHALMPGLKESGVSGYWTIAMPPRTPKFSLFGMMIVHDKPRGTIESLYAPVQAVLDKHADSNIDTDTAAGVSSSANVTYHGTFLSAWTAYAGLETVANTGATMGARFFDAGALTRNSTKLARGLEAASAPATDAETGAVVGPPAVVLVHMVANSNRRDQDGEVAINPAWRDTVLTFLLIEPFADYADAEDKAKVYTRMTKERVPVLKELAPDTGAYFNEADPYDPEFQFTFWNDKYPRLKAIKDEYDPDSLFYCLGCVGSEKWQAGEDGRLCHKSGE